LLATGAEPFSVVECVERHRLYWRPQRINTLLLAESHVYTHGHECIDMQGTDTFGLSDLTRQFVRLVYCLGYGESDFVGQTLANNSGTPQYWKLFSSCVLPPSADTFALILKSHSRSFRGRLQAKIDLLNRLRKLGVWLLDASILALYQPGGGRLHVQRYNALLRCCWENYIGPVIQDAAPHSLVVIGKGVRAALQQELKQLTRIRIETIPQPQARLPSLEIAANYNLLHRVCQNAASARERGDA